MQVCEWNVRSSNLSLLQGGQSGNRVPPPWLYWGSPSLLSLRLCFTYKTGWTVWPTLIPKMPCSTLYHGENWLQVILEKGGKWTAIDQRTSPPASCLLLLSEEQVPENWVKQSCPNRESYRFSWPIPFASVYAWSPHPPRIWAPRCATYKGIDLMNNHYYNRFQHPSPVSIL